MEAICTAVALSEEPRSRPHGSFYFNAAIMNEPVPSVPALPREWVAVLAEARANATSVVAEGYDGGNFRVDAKSPDGRFQASLRSHDTSVEFDAAYRIKVTIVDADGNIVYNDVTDLTAFNIPDLSWLSERELSIVVSDRFQYVIAQGTDATWKSAYRR